MCGDELCPIAMHALVKPYLRRPPSSLGVFRQLFPEDRTKAGIATVFRARLQSARIAHHILRHEGVATLATTTSFAALSFSNAHIPDTTTSTIHSRSDPRSKQSSTHSHTHGITCDVKPFA
jgi:hypothetical protein